MSTLVEVFSVVIPRHVLDASYPGGTDGYLAMAQRHEATRFAVADERLTSVSLASPEAVAAFTAPLEELGLTTTDGNTSAIACVDQHFGPVAPCPWLRWRRHEDGYTSCWLEWTEPGELASPAEWLPERLRSAQRPEARAAAPRSAPESFAPPERFVTDAREEEAVHASNGASNGNGAHHAHADDARPAALTPRDLERLEPVELNLASRYDRMTTPVRMMAVLDAPESLVLDEPTHDEPTIDEPTLDEADEWSADEPPPQVDALEGIERHDDAAPAPQDGMLSLDGLETTAHEPAAEDEPVFVEEMSAVDEEMVIADDVMAAVDDAPLAAGDEAVVTDRDEAVVTDNDDTVADSDVDAFVAAVDDVEEAVVAEEAYEPEPEPEPEPGVVDHEPSPWSAPDVEVTSEEVRIMEAAYDEPPANSFTTAFIAALESGRTPIVPVVPVVPDAADEELPDIEAIETARERSWRSNAAHVEPGATAAFMEAVEREVEELFSSATSASGAASAHDVAHDAAPDTAPTTPLSAPFGGTPRVDRTQILTPQPEAAPAMSAMSLSVPAPQDSDADTVRPSLLDELRQLLAEKGWRYSHDAEHSALFFQMTGTRASYPGCAAVDEQNRLVWLYTQFPVRVPEPRRAAAVELLTRANHGLPVGNFEFDFTDGEVRFKTYVDGGDGCFSAAQGGRMLRASLAACDRYHDALMSVIYGGASAKDAYETARNG